jgi:HEAT repeat protein
MVRPFAASLGLTFLLVAGCQPAATGAGSPAEIDELVAALPSRHWEPAVEALVEIGPPAVEALATAAREPGHAGGRACEALVRIGTEPALALVRAIARGEIEGSRRGALAALALDPAEEARVILIEVLRASPESGTRAQAARSLGRQRAGEAVGPLTKALGDEVEWVRVASAGALGEIGAPEAAPALLERLSDTRAVQRAARGALVELGAPAASLIASAADHRDPMVRWQAAWVLGHIRDEKTRAALVDFEGDPDWRVRNEVAAARQARLVDSLPLYPEALDSAPDIPSPTTLADGRDVVVALTSDDRWTVVPAVPLDDERRDQQRRVDSVDFPTLASTGLHSPEELARTVTITKRSLAEITDLGRPGGLSEDGFMAADEDVLSVLEGDNRLVSALGLTHPQMASPLFHIWNMIEADVEAHRWNYPEHRWDRFQHILYNDRRVEVEAHDTKGGQESIFDDGLGGAFYIKIHRDVTLDEERLLRESYGDLPPGAWNTFIHKLTTIETGEMQPHYIQWYGFYEGHTGWRTDPIAIAFIFGLRSLDGIESAFPGRLPEVLSQHFTR